MTSAAGYAEALSEYSNKGNLNLRDAPDPPGAVVGKAKVLADMIRKARHTVIHTGAGLSTASGISDFRGPTGVWTQQRQKPNTPNESPNPPTKSVSFETAHPTLAHMVIVGLYRAGLVKYVVSQNVDGLHLRSGLPRDALSELHGNVFVEYCRQCGSEFVLECQTRTAGFKETGRKCPKCENLLTDKALDWEDALPEPDFGRAIQNSAASDLNIVVGSSCQMDPARGLPFRNRGKNVKTVLVNLSKTKQDPRFALAIRSTCDTVFAIVASELGIVIPPYERIVPFSFSAALKASPSEDSEKGIVHCQLWASKNIGKDDSIPFLSKVDFSVVPNKDATQSGGDTKKGATQGSGEAKRHSSSPLATETLMRPPYTCALPIPALNFTIQAALHVLGHKDDAILDPHVLHCDAGETVVDTNVHVAVHDYGHEARLIVAEAGEEARKSCKRPLDINVWFCRNAKRRGYVRCAACLNEVFASHKRAHLIECLSAQNSM